MATAETTRSKVANGRGAKTPKMPDVRYQSGFGNEFTSEAVAGTLPQGQNAPQRVAHGLYTEQLSGSPFTAPRAANRRTWLYRIRPSVAHKPFEAIGQGRLRSAPFDEVPTPPNQLRWMPIPIPTERTDFIDGLVTMAGNGDTHTHTGVGIHLYVANASMTDRFFYNADGEMLIVPQSGRLLLRTEMGILEARPGEIAVIQRGIRFRVELLDKDCPRIHLRELWRAVASAGSWADRREWARESARLSGSPVAAFEDREGDFRLATKFQGRLWEASIDHSPLNVVAWHGNYVPYKYDLANFNCINTVSFDHPDPVDLHRADVAFGNSRNGESRLRNFSAALDGGRAYVSSALVSSQLHERIYGTDLRRVRRESGGLCARWRQPAQLHGRARPRCGNVREGQQGRIKPVYIKDTLAFMFETRFACRPTRFALETSELDHQYFECWQGLRKKFDGA